MKRTILLLLITLILTACLEQKGNKKVEQWDVYELALSGPSVGNPYMEVELTALFKNSEEEVRVPGFYDGNGIYRIRFSPHILGRWNFITESNSGELSGRKGSFLCTEPTGENHGPVKLVNTYYLEYADGSPFYSVGTTAYQWTSVKQSIQSKTLETLKTAPFNKIRMCVFPKSYRYGNDTEPWMYPYERNGEENDLEQPEYEFFRNFDKRVNELREMGIQADVILFHPYDKWGYSKMGRELNKRYVRYMIARLSAYRNVWWSLANEWDVPRIKEAIDWEGIGTLLQNEDPHRRLRGIHNWYGSEDHFYDHTRPWITHVSAQTSQFYNVIKWRNQYQKPILLDEMRYEGDVKSSWGSLSAEEMTSYFWMAGMSGGYPTHGDTFQNDSDDGSEVRWWAKGGYLPGDSPSRIRYFKSIMEQAPVRNMVPQINTGDDPKYLNDNIYIFSLKAEYYLAYVADAGKVIEINLEGEQEFKMDVIDTWNMQVTEQSMVNPGVLKYSTTLPYTALRIYHD